MLGKAGCGIELGEFRETLADALPDGGVGVDRERLARTAA